jgi:hypothetical protein
VPKLVLFTKIEAKGNGSFFSSRTTPLRLKPNAEKELKISDKLQSSAFVSFII